MEAEWALLAWEDPGVKTWRSPFTGMRRSEALELRLSDVTADGLVIRPRPDDLPKRRVAQSSARSRAALATGFSRSQSRGSSLFGNSCLTLRNATSIVNSKSSRRIRRLNFPVVG